MTLRKLLSLIMLLSFVGAEYAAAHEIGRRTQRRQQQRAAQPSENGRISGSAFQCALRKAKEFHRRNKGSKRLKDNIVVLIDYDAPANTQRMAIVNLSTGAVRRHTVAKGSGGINTRPGSHGSELGFMRFAETYHGKHGLSVRIDGLEADNRDARRRAIVLHGASYVKENGHAGRSWGCPAVDRKSAPGIIRQVKNGALLFSYRGSRVCR